MQGAEISVVFDRDRVVEMRTWTKREISEVNQGNCVATSGHLDYISSDWYVLLQS